MFSFPIITTLTIYFIIIIAIGLYSSHLNKNLSDFILGGRNLGSTVTALGAGASDMSGWLLLGLPGAVYGAGLDIIWMPIGLTIGAYLNWRFVAKRLRIYTEVANDSLTIPAYLDNRFKDHSNILRIVTALAIILFFTFYAASGFVSGGIVFTHIFQMDYKIAIWVGAIIIMFYTTVGGFLAVNWIDLLQGSLIMIALIIVPITTLLHLGSWEDTLAIIDKINPTYVNAWTNFSWIPVLSLLAWGLGYFGQPHILVRFMAAKSPKHIPKARFICMNWMIISLYGAVFTGFLGIAFFAHTPLANKESVFIELAKQLFNPWVVGFLFAAILSAVMSAIAAQLLAAASALTEDFYHKFFHKNPSPREAVFISRLAVFLMSLIAILLASGPTHSVLNLVSYAWSGLGASFGPAILFSLFWARMTRNGAIAGIVTGASIIIIWNYFNTLGGIFNLYGMVPAFFAGSIMIILVSYLSKTPSKQILEEFNKVKEISQAS